jgi:hypothetical protein
LHTASLNYKLIKKIKDDRFDEDKIHQYTLLISIGTRDMQIGVVDDADARMLLLEDYVFPALNSHSDLRQMLDQLFDAHYVLKAAFWKQIKIAVKNNKFVQVPAVLFVENASADYLKYNAQISPEEEDFLSVANPRSNAITIFAMQRDLREWFNSLYPKNTPLFVHQSSALIEGVTVFAENKKHDNLYIYVDRFKLHILAYNNGKLLYYNQFVIKQFSDYVRYIMLVMKSLNYDQRTSQVFLWGYIGKNSPHYHEFYKYINNVIFGSRPHYLKFGYMFDEVQDHHFFDLYSIHLLDKS